MHARSHSVQGVAWPIFQGSAVLAWNHWDKFSFYTDLFDRQIIAFFFSVFSAAAFLSFTLLSLSRFWMCRWGLKHWITLLGLAGYEMIIIHSALSTPRPAGRHQRQRHRQKLTMIWLVERGKLIVQHALINNFLTLFAKSHREISKCKVLTTTRHWHTTVNLSFSIFFSTALYFFLSAEEEEIITNKRSWGDLFSYIQ